MFVNAPSRRFKRSIGLLLLCLIGIDGTIGGSIFVLLAGGVELAGSHAPLAFLLGGLLALLGGLLYAEVGTTIPRPGADLAFVFTAAKKRHYPFLFSWAVLLADIGYLAINALAFAYYTSLVLGLPALAVALGVLGLAALINLRGVKKAGLSEGVTLAALLVLFIVFAVYVGLNAPALDTLTAEGTGLSGVLAATALIFTSFVGYEYVATLAGETKRPERNIPLALIIVIGFSTLVFTAIAYLAVTAAPLAVTAESSAPLLSLAEYIGGAAPGLIVMTAILATGGSLLAATMVASRRLYALGSEGFFGQALQRINARGVPALSVLVCSGLAALLAATQAVNFVAYVSNSVYLLGFVVIALSIIALRFRRPYLPRPFRAPLFPWLPLFTIALAGTLLLFVELRSLALVGLWIFIGWAVYLLSMAGDERRRWALTGAGGFSLLILLLVLTFWLA